MLSSAAAVGSASCRRREQAALDFSALSELDRGSGEDQRQRRGVVVSNAAVVLYNSWALGSRSSNCTYWWSQNRSLAIGSWSFCRRRLRRRGTSRRLRQRRGWVMCSARRQLWQTNATPVSTSSPSLRLLFRWSSASRVGWRIEVRYLQLAAAVVILENGTPNVCGLLRRRERVRK